MVFLRKRAIAGIPQKRKCFISRTENMGMLPGDCKDIDNLNPLRINLRNENLLMKIILAGCVHTHTHTHTPTHPHTHTHTTFYRYIYIYIYIKALNIQCLEWLVDVPSSLPSRTFLFEPSPCVLIIGKVSNPDILFETIYLSWIFWDFAKGTARLYCALFRKFV